MKKNLTFHQQGEFDEDEEEVRDEPVTNFSAIRRLKNTENDVEAIRNRINMLKLTEEKHIRKLQEEQRRISRLIQLREENQRQRAHRQRSVQNSSENLELLKQQNQESRRQAHNKLASLRSELQEMRANEYQQMKQKSHHIDESIRREKRKHQNENFLKRNNVVQFEEQHREYAQEYQQNRLNDIHSRIDTDTRTVLRKQSSKEAELRRLEQLEMQLVERCQRSSQAFQQVRNRRENLMRRSPSDKQNTLPQLHPSDQ